MGYSIISIAPDDKRGQAAVEALLQKEGIRRDAHLDYTCGVYDDELNLCATGSCFRNTLRCMAVSHQHRGEGLMNLVVNHLQEVQLARGNAHLFLYTKPDSAKFFSDLGFYEIGRVKDKLVFMENRRHGFYDWLCAQQLRKAPRQRTAAVVMNANPFTLGHRYLLEQACQQADVVHLFVLSEEFGVIPAQDRKRMVEAGCCDLPQIVMHDSGPYMISTATFPGYFLKDNDEADRVHAQLDIALFVQIAEKMNIGKRFVGDEPFSRVTHLYHQVMQEELKRTDIQCCMIPRLQIAGSKVSASWVRQNVHDGRMDAVRQMLPQTTWDYLNSVQGSHILQAICNEEQLIHH